jgi:uncharacterized membrane protein
VLEFEGDEAGENGGGIELSDDRLEVGEAAGKNFRYRTTALWTRSRVTRPGA